MFKTYTYKSITFQTITIPKGTVLFRGLRFDNETQYDSLFHDMIGYKKDNSYTISPSMNVFFYPVPGLESNNSHFRCQLDFCV